MSDSRIIETKRLSAHQQTPTQHERSTTRVRASVIRKPNDTRAGQPKGTVSR